MGMGLPLCSAWLRLPCEEEEEDEEEEEEEVA